MDPRLRKRIELEKLMGVDFVFRSPAPVEAQPQDEAGSATSEQAPQAEAAPTVEEALAEVEEMVMDCTRCGLSETRTQGVFSRGRADADLMIIGEAPGADEDARGEPFVGRAGKLLDLMIAAMGLERDEVYITNILKSRPPGNRDPRSDEIEACWPYLERQIELVAPRVLMTVGKPAANTLLENTTAMGRLRAQWHEYRGIPLMCTYHPAYLLRSPGQKAKTWHDLKMVMQRLREMG
jgi:DNA polymerase